MFGKGHIKVKKESKENNTICKKGLKKKERTEKPIMKKNSQVYSMR